MPARTPVTIPEPSTDAVPLLALDQDPPAGVPVNEIEFPEQIVEAPVIAAGDVTCIFVADDSVPQPFVTE